MRCLRLPLLSCFPSPHVSLVLKELAQAARDGDKQKLILTSRELAQRMKDFAVVLKRYGGNIKLTSIPAKDCQNQLYRSGQSMTNLGMQMKILCSVKAATLETNKVSPLLVVSVGTDVDRTRMKC